MFVRAASKHRRRPLVAFVLGSAVASSFPSCALVSDLSADQCSTTDDCVRNGLLNRLCFEGLCKSPGPGERCETNTQCNEQSGGGRFICRAADRTCVSLVSRDCNTVVGSFTGEAPVFLGSLFTTLDVEAGYGLPMQRAVELAVTQINLEGLYVGASRREVVLVGCNDTGDAQRALAHLVGDVGVRAVVGPDSPARARTIAKSDAFRASGALLMALSPVDALLDEGLGAGLLWSKPPSDKTQADALAALVRDREAAARAERALPADAPLKLAFVGYGQGGDDNSPVFGALSRVDGVLTINGAAAASQPANFFSARYDFSDEDFRGGGLVQDLLAFGPDVVLVVGGVEAVRGIVAPLEAAWPATGPRPQYVFSSSARTPELLTDVVARDPRVRARVAGTSPQGSQDSAEYKRFVEDYRQRFASSPGERFGPAQAYDAAYLIAYAAVVNGDQPLTGAALTRALSNNFGGPGNPVAVGTAGISTALQALNTDRGSITFLGAAGPVAWDATTGESKSPVDVWCVTPAAASGDQPAGFQFESSGLVYDPRPGALQGRRKGACGADD
jgi:branched-chain amino acid transport system substrate-binding protein